MEILIKRGKLKWKIKNRKFNKKNNLLVKIEFFVNNQNGG